MNVVCKQDGDLPRRRSGAAGEMVRFAKTDVLFCAVTCVSSALLLVIHLLGEPDMLGALVAFPIFAPWFFFVVSLCQAFQDGIAAGQHHVQAMTTGSPWLSFGKLLGRRICLWVPLWGIFLVGLQPWRIDFGLALCVFIAGLIAGTVAGCFVWAPVCRKVWTLAVATVLTLGAVVAGLLVLSSVAIEALGMGGYMGLGHFVYTPMVTSGCLFVAAIAAAGLAWWRGEWWFRLHGTQSGERQS